jgi:hypothetical protein
VVAKRNLTKIKRIPDLLIFSTIQPIMFVLLFAYVFGSAIPVEGVNYREFLIARHLRADRRVWSRHHGHRARGRPAKGAWWTGFGRCPCRARPS